MRKFARLLDTSFAFDEELEAPAIIFQITRSNKMSKQGKSGFTVGSFRLWSYGMIEEFGVPHKKTVKGQTLERGVGTYDLGYGKKSYPVDSGLYKAIIDTHAPGSASSKYWWASTEKIGGNPFYWVPELKDTDPFTGIDIHIGNTVADSAGCILVGDSVNKDGFCNNSAATMDKIMRPFKMMFYNKSVPRIDDDYTTELDGDVNFYVQIKWQNDLEKIHSDIKYRIASKNESFTFKNYFLNDEQETGSKNA